MWTWSERGWLVISEGWYLLEVFEVRKDIHVSKWVYSNDRTVRRSFLDMEQRMTELLAVCMQEVYGPWGGDINVMSTSSVYRAAWLMSKWTHTPFSLMSWRATSCWNFSKLSPSSLTWNKMRKGIPSSVSSWKTHMHTQTKCQRQTDYPQTPWIYVCIYISRCIPLILHQKAIDCYKVDTAVVYVTNLSIFKGDLPDQRHTLILGPSIRQVKVGEWAEEDHVRDTLSDWLVDDIVSTEAFRLRYSAKLRINRIEEWQWDYVGLNDYGKWIKRRRLTQRQPRMCSRLEGCWQLFHMSGSYRSPFFQSSLWCFFCSSVEYKRKSVEKRNDPNLFHKK